MLRKMFMKVTADKYQLPIYYADTVRELSMMCRVRRSKIERAIKALENKYKPKEFIVVIYDDEDDS